MRTISLRQLLLLTLVLAVSCGASSHPVSREVETIYNSSVAIYLTSDKDKPRIFCSGTVIDHRPGQYLFVLTAAHCKKGRGNLISVIGDEDGRSFSYEVRVVKSDTKIDLALLKSVVRTRERGSRATVSCCEPYIGEKLWTAGSPGASYKVLSHGILSRALSLKGLNPSSSDLPGFPGNSGGAIFNQNQEIVGIIVSIRIDQLFPASPPVIVPGQVLAVSLPVLQSFLSRK